MNPGDRNPNKEGDKDMRRNSSEQEEQPGTAALKAVGRMVDARIPLAWLLGGGFGLCWVLVSMWFSLQQIKEDMVTLKASVAVSTATTSELALIKFRLGIAENDLNQLKANGNK